MIKQMEISNKYLMKRYHIFIMIFSIVLFSCNKKESGIYPLRKDLTQAVYASGKLFPINNYKVFTKWPGYVQKIHVKIGDIVKAGDPLITIKSESNELNAEAMRNMAGLAQRNASSESAFMNALKSDVAAAKTKFELDSINYMRYVQLKNQNATSGVQFDLAKAQYEISRQTYQKALNAFISSKDKAATDARSLQLQYEAQNANRNEFVITADKDGKVYDIDVKTGELAGTQRSLMEMGDALIFQAELSVDETDISFIKIGQEILYTIDAYRDRIFKGKVTETYPRISASNKTSKVIATIEGLSSSDIYSGMSVEANIIISRKKNVMVIPREYLLEGNYVRLKENKDSVKVTTGAEDLEFVEVLNGLTETQEIIK